MTNFQTELETLESLHAERLERIEELWDSGFVCQRSYEIMQRQALEDFETERAFLALWQECEGSRT